MATPSEFEKMITASDEQIEGLQKGQQIPSCLRLKDFCAKYHLIEDIWPLFIENFIYYDLLFSLNDHELIHLLKNEWNLSFLQMKRIEAAIQTEKQEAEKAKHDKSKQLQSQIAELNIANMAKITQINDLQSCLDAKTLEITSLQRTVCDLRSQMANNAQQRKRNESTQSELKDDLDEMNKKFKALEVRLRESEATNDYLQRICNAQTKELERLNGIISNKSGNDAKNVNIANKRKQMGQVSNSNVWAQNRNKKNSKDRNGIRCECGQKLERMELPAAYGTNHAQCCQCHEWINDVEAMIWHCPDGFCYAHPNGFDICDACSKKT